MKPIETSSGLRHKIYPTSDERFLRVMEKIVRGLHYYERRSTVPDDLVSVDILKVDIPSEFLEAMPVYHREPDIFKYQFIASVWKSAESQL